MKRIGFKKNIEKLYVGETVVLERENEDTILLDDIDPEKIKATQPISLSIKRVVGTNDKELNITLAFKAKNTLEQKDIAAILMRAAYGKIIDTDIIGK